MEAIAERVRDDWRIAHDRVTEYWPSTWTHDYAERLMDALELHERGWLPIALCPTDGVERMLRLSDGRELPGRFKQYLGWEVQIDVQHMPVQQLKSVAGLERVQPGYDIRVVQTLPDGVHPTHYRPNDTVHGLPAFAPPDDSPDDSHPKA